MVAAVASLVIMIIAKSRCKKAERQLADSRDEYERNKEEIEKKFHIGVSCDESKL